MVIPALIYKIFEWIYYKFFATGPPDPNRKTFEEKFPCPMANSGLPNPHKEMTEKGIVGLVDGLKDGEIKGEKVK